MSPGWERIRLAIGAEFSHVNHAERAISVVGGFIGVLAVMVVSGYLLDAHGAAWVIVSAGASAVLIFAVPHGQLSQPWPVLGGHVVSALIGVTCTLYISSPLVAGALAVACAIAAMHYLRCIHPPGGATALTAVVGGDQVHALGYAFALTPVATNILILLLTAVAVNWLFPWRRYPLSLARKPAGEVTDERQVDEADLDWALRQINSYIDVSEADLARIVDLAYRHARERHLSPREIVRGGCYSNGRFDDAWQVRKVVDELGEETIIYRVLAGEGRGNSAICLRETLAQWARYRVVRNGDAWQRVDPPQADADAARDKRGMCDEAEV